ncbi:hypothetical protein L917_04722 [Phytophthora nicotianae]|uniref:Uncharacterized protein n=1 Tax=Phytophthora nicotianae TaxID=4792 RepID=W2LL24_PHYNI|nr:hypothetical protein L917_04722 [Phytophthora nicotianae]
MTPNVSVFPRLYKDMHAWITLCADSGEVKARLQEDERMEEEEYFLSLSKALPVGQVQAAALRNYQAAGKLRWKKLMFQSIAEQQQLDEEMAECLHALQQQRTRQCLEVKANKPMEKFSIVYTNPKPTHQLRLMYNLGLAISQSGYRAKWRLHSWRGKNAIKLIGSVDARSLQLSYITSLTSRGSQGTHRKYAQHCVRTTLINMLAITKESTRP